MKIVSLVFESIRQPCGGMGVYCFNIGKQLSKLGVDITFIECDEELKPGIFFFDERSGQWIEKQKLSDCPKNAVKILSCKSYTRHRFCPGVYNDMQTVENYTKNFLEFIVADKDFTRPDILHLNDAYLDNVAQIIETHWRGIKKVLTSHLSCFLMLPVFKHGHHRYRTERELIGYHHADRIIAVSHSYKDQIENKMLVRKPIDVIHNGVVQPIEKTNHKDKVKNIGFLGRPVVNKGVLQIIEAAKALPQYNFYLWTIFGGGNIQADNIEIALKDAEQKLSNFFLRQPHCPRTKWREICQEIDLGIMPSIHEPFGIVALEWLMARIPLVYHPVDGLNDFLDETKAISTCLSEKGEPSVDGLVEAIEIADRHYVDFVNLSLATQEYAKSFSWEESAKKHIVSFEATLAEAKKRRSA